MTEAQYWENFMAMIGRARGAADGRLPVALILLAADRAADGGLDVSIEAPAVLWPAEFPDHLRFPLLGRIASAYEHGTTRRLGGVIDDDHF